MSAFAVKYIAINVQVYRSQYSVHLSVCVSVRCKAGSTRAVTYIDLKASLFALTHSTPIMVLRFVEVNQYNM